MGQLARLVACVGVAVLVLAGCGNSGGGDAKVKLAESRVSDEQKALADAQSQLAAKTDAFCKSSATYITALDRYGDVLHRTAPTVTTLRRGHTIADYPTENQYDGRGDSATGFLSASIAFLAFSRTSDERFRSPAT